MLVLIFKKVGAFAVIIPHSQTIFYTDGNVKYNCHLPLRRNGTHHNNKKHLEHDIYIYIYVFHSN